MSTIVTRVPSVSNVATARLSDSRRFCSSGSKSRCEVPSSTLPTRPTAPDLCRSCSPSVVLPAPAWPARTTLRRWGRSTLLVVMGRSILVAEGRVEGGPAIIGPPVAAIVVRYTPGRCPDTPNGRRSSAQKGVKDAKRSAVFTKVAREISVAARAGWRRPRRELPAAPRDRQGALGEHARGQHQAGDRQGDRRRRRRAVFEEIVYEGYGPGGVAILVEAATDNRNRTAADVRALFTKAGGQLAGSGAVAWQFEPRGLITIPAKGQDPDDVALAAIDAGAEDVDTSDDEVVEVYTTPGGLEQVRKALDARRRAGRAAPRAR